MKQQTSGCNYVLVQVARESYTTTKGPQSSLQGKKWLEEYKVAGVVCFFFSQTCISVDWNHLSTYGCWVATFWFWLFTCVIDWSVLGKQHSSHSLYWLIVWFNFFRAWASLSMTSFWVCVHACVRACMCVHEHRIHCSDITTSTWTHPELCLVYLAVPVPCPQTVLFVGVLFGDI